MKKYHLLISFFMLLILGCSKSSEESGSNKEELEISTEYSELLFGSDKQSQTIAFSTTVGWEIFVDHYEGESTDWITFSHTYGDAGDNTVNIIIGENTDVFQRSATLVLCAGGSNFYIYIYQSEASPALSLSTESKAVSADEGSFSLDIFSNTDWYISDLPSWITLNTYNGYKDETIVVSYSANKTYEERSGSFNISIDGKTIPVTVIQEGEEFIPTLTVSKTDETVEVGSGSFSINIISNTDWTISDVSNWITLSATSGSGNLAVSVNYSANETYDDRVGTFVITAATISVTVKITQDGMVFIPTLSVDKVSETVTPQAGLFTVNISSNTDWTTTNTTDWITLNPTSGNGDTVMTVSYTVNETYDSRVGSFSISVEGITHSITVTQEVNPSIVPTDPDINDWGDDDSEDNGGITAK